MKIEINGLYGRKNILVDLNQDVSIIMAENGSGKTTTLKFIESIFTGCLENLVDIQFDDIQVIDGKKKVTILKKEIEVPYYVLLNQFKKRDAKKYERLKNEMSEYVSVDEREEFIEHRIRRYTYDMDLNPSFFYRYAQNPDTKKSSLKKIIKKANSLKRENVVLFPTYRRVEKDLSIKLENHEKEISIAFGMKDVKEKFERIQNELSIQALDLASSINKKLIVDAMTDKEPPKKFFDSIIDNKEDIDLMLDRTRITSQKKHLMDIILSKDFSKTKIALAQIIYHLTEGFRELKKKDNKIKKFVDIVNEYLIWNKFVYDDRLVKIYCVNQESRDVIDLDYLSSGEKQIVGLLSFIYLSENNDYTIIIDEPEISLSTEWQERLITDIMNSGSVKSLICATHSPYIFKEDHIGNLVPLISK